MMNKVIIQGRLTDNAKFWPKSENKSSFCIFSIACDRDYVKNGEERKADFFPVKVWGLVESFVSKYLVKGDLVDIVGRLEQRSWEDEEGKKHNVTEIIGENVYPTQFRKSDDGAAVAVQNETPQEISEEVIVDEDPFGGLPVPPPVGNNKKNKKK